MPGRKPRAFPCACCPLTSSTNGAPLALLPLQTCQELPETYAPHLPPFRHAAGGWKRMLPDTMFLLLPPPTLRGTLLHLWTCGTFFLSLCTHHAAAKISRRLYVPISPSSPFPKGGGTLSGLHTLPTCHTPSLPGRAMAWRRNRHRRYYGIVAPDRAGHDGERPAINHRGRGVMLFVASNINAVCRHASDQDRSCWTPYGRLGSSPP